MDTAGLRPEFGALLGFATSATIESGRGPIGATSMLAAQ
jgi:hypothetical protein